MKIVNGIEDVRLLIIVYVIIMSWLFGRKSNSKPTNKPNKPNIINITKNHHMNAKNEKQKDMILMLRSMIYKELYEYWKTQNNQKNNQKNTAEKKHVDNMYISIVMRGLLTLSNALNIPIKPHVINIRQYCLDFAQDVIITIERNKTRNGMG